MQEEPTPLDRVVAKDPRYRAEAYLFVYDGLNYAQKLVSRTGHVTGQELSEGCRRLALERYGRMAKAVLNSWGLRSTDDFGNIVYNLIAANLMSKTEEDTIADFHAVFDFDAGLVQSYDFPARTDKP